MNERHQDFELLQQFVRHGQQDAFTAVVRRHLDLVYGTAMRKVEEQGAAEEVAQNVFAALARKAWRFAPDDSLPAWLHRTTLLESKAWLRGELRRRRREQTAIQLGTTMKEPDNQPSLRALLPILDEALLSLREKDRAALLLRYYESRSLREVGVALGVKEDAAQKRVASALEQLTSFFKRHGFKTATTVLAASALQQTATSAPTVTATAILQSAAQVAPPTLAGLAPLLTRLASMGKLQTASLCGLLVMASITAQWYQLHTAEKAWRSTRTKLADMAAQETKATAELERLRAESAKLEVALAEATQAQIQAEANNRHLETLQSRLQAMLTDPNYRWPDDLPYIRVPKAQVKQLDLMSKFGQSGELSQAALEFYAITPGEKRVVEKSLGDYWRETLDLMNANAYETNVVSSGTKPDRVVKTVYVPPLGQELKSLADDTRSRLTDALGEEREQLLFSGWDEGAIQLFWPGNLWKISEESQTFSVWADPAATKEPLLGTSWNSGLGGMSSEGTQSLGIIPTAIAARFFQPWLQQLGIPNSSHSSNQ